MQGGQLLSSSAINGSHVNDKDEHLVGSIMAVMSEIDIGENNLDIAARMMEVLSLPPPGGRNGGNIDVSPVGHG